MPASRSASLASDLALAAIRRSLTELSWRNVRRRMEEPQLFLWMIGAILLLTVLWACLTPVDRVVRVEGKVIPAGHSQSIQHLEGGIVAAINVQEGQVVHKGEVLLSIDDTTANATLQESRTKQDGMRIRAVRLEAEAREADSMTFPQDLRGSSELMVGEQQLFKARRQKLEQEKRILEEQIRQRNIETQEIQAKKLRLEGELNLARERSKMMSSLAQHAAASKLEVLEAQSREQRLNTELGDAQAMLPKVQGSIAEANARIEEARARYRAEAQGELSNVRLEIDRLDDTIKALVDRFTRTEVRAPVDGIVNRVTVNTVGGVVKAGDTIIELTPNTDRMMLEAKARPSDRAELRVGLPAKIRITAYDVGELGTLSGKVTEVSADTVQDGKMEPYYRVVIQVDDLPEAYAGKQIVPGMTITGDVVIGRRTVMRYITAPFAKFTYSAFRDAR